MRTEYLASILRVELCHSRVKNMQGKKGKKHYQNSKLLVTGYLQTTLKIKMKLDGAESS